MTTETLGGNETEQRLSALAAANLTVIPKHYEDSNLIDLGDDCKLVHCGDNLPLIRPTPEQTARRDRLLRISRAVGIIEGYFYSWHTEVGYSGTLKEIDQIELG